jgi:hypothetical protein
VPDGISACEPECTNIARNFETACSLKNAAVVFFEPSCQSVFDRNPRVYIVRRFDAKHPEADHDKADAVEARVRIATLMVIGNAEHG